MQQVGVLDADRWAICPDCLTRINCGPSGLGNLEKRHRRTPTCNDNKAKRAKEKLKNCKMNKNRSLLNYFKKPKVPSIPSTVSNPAQVHGHKLAPEQAVDSGMVITTGPWCDEAAVLSSAGFQPVSRQIPILDQEPTGKSPRSVAASDYDRLELDHVISTTQTYLAGNYGRRLSTRS
jgi:hypothetical protein